jgi:hypothetical protein
MLNSRCGYETGVEGWLSYSLESMVRCLVGRIEGVTVVVLNGRIAGGGLDEDTEVDVAIMFSAVVRRPARRLGL